MKLFRGVVASLLIVAGSVLTAEAQVTKYWDINGTNAGSTDTPPDASGTWDGVHVNWNTDSTGGGGGTLSTWTASDDAVFSAGTDAISVSTILVSGTQTANSLLIEDGTASFSNGTVSVSNGTTGTVNVASGATATFAPAGSILAGANGITKTGTGTLFLGSNSHTFSTASGAQLTINSGVVDFATDLSLGAAPAAARLGAVTINGGTLRYGGTGSLTLNVNRGIAIGASGGTIEVPKLASISGLSMPSASTSALSGSGILTKTGAGRFTMNTSQTTFTGKYRILNGLINVPGDGRFGAVPGSPVADYFFMDGGGIRIGVTTSQTINANRGITLGSNGGKLIQPGATTAPGLVYNGIIAGTLGGSLTLDWQDAASTNSEGGATGGIISLGGANTYDGQTFINAGATLRLTAAGAVPNTSVVNLAGAAAIFDLATNTISPTVKSIAGAAGTVAVGTATLTVANPNGETFGTSGVISASAGGKVIKNGSGAWTLSGSSTGFNGEFVMNAGTLGVGNSNMFGNGADNTDASTFTYNGGVLSNTATNGRTIPAGVSVNVNANLTADDSLFNSSTPGQILFNGPITLKNSDRTITVNGTANLGLGGVVGDEGAGRGIIKNGNGTLALPNAANTYSGSTTINAGAINLDSDGTLGTGAGNLNLNGGALNATASRSGTGSIVLNPVQLTASSSITCSATAVTPIFEFSGALTGTAGQVLTFRDDAAAATQFKPRFSGVFTFDSDIDMPTGSGAAAAKVQLESFNTTGTTQTFTGTISGTGSYNRSASSAGTGGTTVFTGNNTYSGGTSVTRGSLLANNTSGSATGSGAVSVGGNGTLGGKGSVDGLVTVSNFGIVAPGNPGVSNGIDTLTLKGGLTVLEGGNLNFDLGAPGTGDKIDLLTSTLTLPATSSPSTAFVNLTDTGGLAVGTYTLIDYGTNDPGGSLSNVAIVGPGGFNYSLFDNTGATTIELHVMAVVAGLPGDFNSDGQVDAGDYATWRKAFDGSPTAPNAALANDNGLGTPITTAHYDLWRANFGNPPGAGSGGGLGSTAAVPEPNTIVLLAMGLLTAGMRRRR